MELMQGVEDFINAVVYLGLLIYCLMQLRKKGMVFLSIGIGLLFINSSGWLAFSLLINRISYEFYDIFYMTLAQFNFAANLLFALFFMLGIYQITRSLDKNDDETTQTHRIKDLTPPRKFGNTGLYVSMLITGFFLMVLGTLFIVIIDANGGSDAGLIIMGIAIFFGFIIMTISWIYFCVLLYRVWKFAIVESRRHNLKPSVDTPGKAVGFLFIPFFNFYWIFKAYGSLPKDLNAIARAKNINAAISEGLGISLAVICLLSIIPFIGYILGLVVLILAPIFISSSISISKKLSEASDSPE